MFRIGDCDRIVTNKAYMLRPDPQSPISNPQSPIPNPLFFYNILKIYKLLYNNKNEIYKNKK